MVLDGLGLCFETPKAVKHPKVSALVLPTS